MLDAYRRAVVRLNACFFTPLRTRRALLERFGGDILRASLDDWLALGSFRERETAAAARGLAAAFDPDAELSLAEKLGARLVFPGDAGYPRALRGLSSEPLMLYWKGAAPVEPAHAAAVVGSRRADSYGLRMARQLTAELAGQGLIIVSGLARGIDGAAHEAALAAGATTWAVLGSGLETVYPPEHWRLAQRIVEAGGALVSEVPLSARPHKLAFPLRNRLISGLSFGVLVVQGRRKSGSLSTAKAALEQDRPVFAVPGPADSPLSEAPHQLIAEGATLVCGLKDMAEALPVPVRAFSFNRKTPPAGPSLPPEQAKVLQCLGSEGASLDELCAATGLDLPRLSTIIFELEIQQLIDSLPGQRYAKKGQLGFRQH